MLSYQNRICASGIEPTTFTSPGLGDSFFSHCTIQLIMSYLYLNFFMNFNLYHTQYIATEVSYENHNNNDPSHVRLLDFLLP